MKSEHRHELETNWLAHRVAGWLDEVRPYNSLIAGILLAAAALIFGYSYFSGESATRQSAAWNSYNAAVEGPLPNLDTLRESAEEFPDSPMQQWADITWADGQVWLASRYYIQSRSAAMEALNRASSTYQSLLQDATDERLKDRAHFGLGRVYELQNELDKAREEYGAVKGGFARLAEQRAKQLEEPEVKDTYAWLATAQAPRRTLPDGAIAPGQRPDFDAGNLEMPSASKKPSNSGAAMSVDDLFNDIGEPGDKDDPSVTDRYSNGNAATEDAASEPAKSDNAEPKE